MFYPIHAINLNLLQVKGRSDLFLRLEIIKKALTTVVLFATAPFGVLVMCYGIIFTSFSALIINTYYTGKLINVGFFKQITDIFPVLLLSFITGFLAYFPSLFLTESYFQLAVGGFSGTLFFIVASYLLKFSELNELKIFLFKQDKI
jgi:O-antigen/teichoic acid export membrane protein